MAVMVVSVAVSYGTLRHVLAVWVSLVPLGWGKSWRVLAVDVGFGTDFS